MVTKVQRWGTSQGLRLTKRVLEDARISVGDEVDVLVRDGAIVVRPTSHVRGKYDLRQLVAAIPKGHKAEEVDWGRPMGKGVW